MKNATKDCDSERSPETFITGDDIVRVGEVLDFSTLEEWTAEDRRMADRNGRHSIGPRLRTSPMSSSRSNDVARTTGGIAYGSPSPARS